MIVMILGVIFLLLVKLAFNSDGEKQEAKTAALQAREKAEMQITFIESFFSLTVSRLSL